MKKYLLFLLIGMMLFIAACGAEDGDEGAAETSGSGSREETDTEEGTADWEPEEAIEIVTRSD